MAIVDSHRSISADVLYFVGREKSVARGIDWRSPEMSRLWRYHLHYFDYLRDDFRTLEWKNAAIDDWIDSNPPGTCDAWEPYPTSLRIVNWIKFFDALRITDPGRSLRLQSLYRQVLWLENNLERHILANHYLKNAKALVFAGVYFFGADADRWRHTGLRILRAQVVEQFLHDGGHYERSPMYHAICVEDLLDTINIIGTCGALVAEETLVLFRERARAGLDYLDAILMPDGEIPLFNDAALDMAPACAALFDYAKCVIGYRKPEAMRGPSGIALSSSGYYVMRDGDDAIVIDCGEVGPSYQAGHAHCDTLGYELAIGGKRLIVDSGVYDYEAGPRREYVRGTSAHNTVSIDAREQSEIWGVFRVGHRARPILAEFHSDSPDGVLRFEGAHDGYRRFGQHVVHRRSVTYTAGKWVIEDTVEGDGSHLIESRIHLAPELYVVPSASSVQVTDLSGKRRASIRYDSWLNVRIETGPYHLRFGETQERVVIVLFSTAPLPYKIRYTVTA